MKSTKRFLLEGNYKQFLSAYGINVEEALRKAGLSADTLNHRSPMMTAENYFSFMEEVSQQACDADTHGHSRGIKDFFTANFCRLLQPKWKKLY